MAKKKFSSDLLRDLHAEAVAPIPSLEEENTELAELSLDEQSRLEECEEVIHKGLKTFVEVGSALYEIRDKKLYRNHFKTFESYCQERWQLKRQRAYELMGAAEIVNQLSENLSEISDKTTIAPPDKESHAAALSRIPAVLRFRAWQKIVEESVQQARPVTVKLINEVTDTLIDEQDTAEPPAKSLDENEELLKQMRSKVAKAKLDDVRIEISGKWLIKNKLEDIWKRISPDATDEISEDYRALITLNQAEKIGIIRKLK
ncbi:hypothetical protein [Telluribacter humicola]|uniref:hypothetical protein n=1 Tax=Telluribacter humicola TaxID=1720261 RepID=UPI001A97C2ED|nr:hypothetical protein [Telluribacter humicola]